MFDLFHYDFFINALLAAVLTSISCGIIGSYIVSRRLVFISGGITHASFGGIGLGYLLGMNPLFFAALFGVASAVSIEIASTKYKIRQDSAIGIFWALGMALGIIFISMVPGYAPNLMSYLFGNILTVSTFDIGIMFFISLLIIAVFTFLYKEILFTAFHEDIMKIQGIKTNILNILLISLVALTIVINIRVIGIILVISLLTIPQATANIFTKDFKRMIIFSVFFALLSSIFGLIMSYHLNTPSGASIIFSAISIFIIAKGGKILLQKNK